MGVQSEPACSSREEAPRKPRPCRSLARGGACLHVQPSRFYITVLPLTAVAAYKRRANRRCSCLTRHLRPNSLPRRGLAGTRSSKKVSLLEGESGLTPARTTYPTRCKHDRACLAACLAEAAWGTEPCFSVVFLLLLENTCVIKN